MHDVEITFSQILPVQNYGIALVLDAVATGINQTLGREQQQRPLVDFVIFEVAVELQRPLGADDKGNGVDAYRVVEEGNMGLLVTTDKTSFMNMTKR